MAEKTIKYLAKNGRIVNVPIDIAASFERSPLCKKRIGKKPPESKRHIIIRGRGGPGGIGTIIEHTDKKELPI